MLHVALLEPEIAGNTGNIARTCVAAGATLHLIRPLGFRLNERALRRAGMDYWPRAEVRVHANFHAFYETFAAAFAARRVFSLTTKGTLSYAAVAYQPGDVLLFGPESRGLPEEVRRLTPQLRIPMTSEARSLNLAVSAGVALYEAWRQLAFGGRMEQAGNS